MHETVKDYYGKALKGSQDLKTDACCTLENMPAYLKPIMAKIHPEVSEKYYGCGLVAPELLSQMRVLDLGCGSGQDCYVLSALVGEQGSVVGVDMTDQQLDVANATIDYHRQQFGFSKSNVRFLKGYIEQLDQLDLAEESFDIIVSNCVINLSPDKQAVLEQAYGLLKPGGELYFSDVYADRRVPEHLQHDPVLYGECLSGALYWNDFLTLAKQAGFTDPRLVSDRPLSIDHSETQEKVDDIHFYSAVYRLFKLANLESSCEDYGQAVTYRGGILHAEEKLLFDKHHMIEQGKVFPVCGNTYRMLRESRFADFFEFTGSSDKHYGIFSGCGTGLPFTQSNSGVTKSCC